MIRYLEKRDAEECVKMLEEFYQTDAVSHKIPTEYMQNSVDLALNNSPYIKILMCEIEGKYAGFCTLSFTLSTEAGGVVVFIEELYIRDEFKGQGLGTAIMKFIRDEFDKDVKRYRLEVTEHNVKAIKLYEKIGFEGLSYKQMVLDL